MRDCAFHNIKLFCAVDIGKTLVKRVDVSFGDNHTTMYNWGDGKTVQFEYQNEKCVTVDPHKLKKVVSQWIISLANNE